MRRIVLLLLMTGIGLGPMLGCSSVSAKTSFGGALFCSANAEVAGVTLLKSHDPDPSDLVDFIRANWFAMDQIAVDQGILVSYDLLSQNGGTESPWNVVVLVGYPSPGGYADVSAEFEKIRSAHETVPIRGFTRLSELGTVVSSSELKVRCG